MVGLEDYIFENARTTHSNKERKEELEKWLKGKKYPDYVKILNKMLDDPKAKTLLVDGFGGDLGDTKFTFRVKLIKPLILRPTQNEIDVDKSVKHSLTDTDNMKELFNDKIITAGMPLVTFRGNYVIDGHHRWAECAMINPEGKMVCFDYDADISPIQMLKAVQGNIAAALVNRDENPKIPSGKTNGPNLYDKEWDREKIHEYVNDKLKEEPAKIFLQKMNIDTDKGEDIRKKALQVICDGIWNVKINNYPEDGVPSRGEMPQTDKAGQEKGSKSSSYPDKEGSALNRMKNGKFDSGAIK